MKHLLLLTLPILLMACGGGEETSAPSPAPADEPASTSGTTAPTSTNTSNTQEETQDESFAGMQVPQAFQFRSDSVRSISLDFSSHFSGNGVVKLYTGSEVHDFAQSGQITLPDYSTFLVSLPVVDGKVTSEYPLANDITRLSMGASSWSKHSFCTLSEI